MRIYCLTSSYPTRSNPSAGSFVQAHCKLLAKAGHDVRVYTWANGAADSELEVIGVSPFGDQSMFSGTGAPDLLEASPWRLVEAPVAASAMLVRLLKDPRPDLYLGHWLAPGGLMARIATRLTGVSSAVVGHSGGVHFLRRMPFSRSWLDLACAGPTTVPSRALAKLVGRGVDVLPMGFEPVDVEIREAAADILCFGRLVPIKGFEDVMEELSRLDDAVHFMGEGPCRERLERRAGELRISAHFHGWGGDAQKREIFPRCSVALFPSRVQSTGRHEGWPVSVLEVASAGVVPLVAPWPGAREMVVDPARQVVSNGDWCSAIADVSRDLSLRRDTKAHAQQFSWGALGERWVDWVESARFR